MNHKYQNLKFFLNNFSQIARDKIGALAAPEVIHPVSGLPKTRSGKIMRRILAKVTRDDCELGDISSMADESILDELFATRHIYAFN